MPSQECQSTGDINMVSYKKASFYEFSKYKNRNVIYLNAVKRPYVRNAGRGHCPRPGLSRE